MENNQYQTLIFDFDDTLIDTKAILKKALRVIYQEHFKSYTTLDIVEKNFNVINHETWIQVSENKMTAQAARIERIKKLATSVKIECIDYRKIAAQFVDLCSKDAVWLPGVETVFFELCKNHTVIIITNGIKEVQLQKAKQLGILGKCSEFLCAEEPDFLKPNAQIFETALKKTNSCKTKTLAIGDSLECDFRGALNTGLDFCWINPQKNKLRSDYPKPKFELNSVNELANLFAIAGPEITRA